MGYSRPEEPLATMTGRIHLLRQIVRNILPALGMPDVDDEGELDDLTLRIGHTGEL